MVNNSVQVILPGIVVAAAALVVLLVDLFLGASRKGALAWIASAGLVVAAAVAAGQWLDFRDGVHFFERHAKSGFAQMVALDKYALFFVVLFCAAGVLTILLSDAYLAARGAPRGEFYALLLLVVAGMIGMAISTDVIALFISFELMSLPTYVLAGYSRRDPRSGEAALKYFINGAFSSAILLFGLGLLYGVSGATTYTGIARGLAALSQGETATMVALVLVIVGFGFKVSAVPFHQWVPDVYEGAPTPVSAFMSVGVKAGAFAGFVKLFTLAAAPQWQTWTNALIVVAVITMVVGNVLALPQRNLKRLLAYSSIAHAGYLLLGLIAAGKAGTTEGSSAVLVYLGAYTFMNLGAFGMLVFVRNRGAFGYTLDEVAGLGRTMPLAALGLTLFMLSLTGIPPTAGFWGKFYLFTAVVNAHLTWLAVVAVVMSAVSAFYYLRVVWYMYFREAPEGAAEAPEGAAEAPEAVAEAPGASGSGELLQPIGEAGTGAALWLAALGVLFIGIYPGPLLWAAQGAVSLILGG
jgi:NADH-quinone oxidoreductase subunit N